MTLASLFDGIGVWQLAAARAGITPLWSSEIDYACCQITKRHFPNTIQLGDINLISDAPKVDIITAGSPCQNLSIAGRREGLHGEKSSLFLFDDLSLISSSGKTSRASLLQTADLILKPSLKKFCRSPFLYLDTSAMQDWLTVDSVKSRGDCLTLNTGASPSVVKESSLSLILQHDAPPKYYLSQRACEGILCRAKNHNVILPQELLSALAETLSIKAKMQNSNRQSNKTCNRL